MKSILKDGISKELIMGAINALYSTKDITAEKLTDDYTTIQADLLSIKNVILMTNISIDEYIENNTIVYAESKDRIELNELLDLVFGRGNYLFDDKEFKLIDNENQDIVRPIVHENKSYQLSNDKSSSKQEKLEFTLNKWKDLLNLNAWDIAITYDKELDCQGSVDIESQNCTALIKIKDPSSWENSYFDLDVEQVLIHELLHIKFNLCEPDEDTKYTLYHQQMNDISKVLFKLYNK